MNDIKFWVPIEFSKAKNEKGEEVMKIGGIASTNAKDSDGEFLDPNGFDVSYFKKSGFLNWHHQTKNDPNAIIGEPTEAKITKDGLYIEGFLYKDNDLAKSVYNMAKVLQKNSSTRRLGFSIEGKALERDPLNDKIVKKAAITGCAITFSPKNPKTYLDIIKGNIEDDYTPEYDEETIMLTKSLSAGAITGTETHNSTEASGAPLKTSKKDKNKLKDLQSDDEEKLSEKKQLSKSKIYEMIFNKYPEVNLSKAEQIYNFILKHSDMAKELKTIEPGDVEKALDFLDKTDDLLKAKKVIKKDEEEDEDEGDEEEKEEVEKSKKSEIKKGDDEEDDEDEDEDMEKSKKEVSTKFVKGKKKKESTEDEESDDDIKNKFAAYKDKMIKKGFMSEDIKKGEEDSLSKSLDSISELIKEKNYAVGIIMKGMYDKLTSLENEISDLKSGSEDIKKSLDSTLEGVDLVKGEIDDLSKSLDQPNERKSKMSSYKERVFAGNDNLEKANGASNSKEISIKRRGDVLTILDNATFEKGFDPEFADALTRFESSGVLAPNIAERIRKEKGIVFTA